MVITTKTHSPTLKLVALVFTATMLSGCANLWWCEDLSTQQRSESPQPEPTAHLELIAELAPETKIESLEKAWGILSPKLSWIGPPNSGFVKIIVSPRLLEREREESAIKLIELFKATKGVIEVEGNYTAHRLNKTETSKSADRNADTDSLEEGE